MSKKLVISLIFLILLINILFFFFMYKSDIENKQNKQSIELKKIFVIQEPIVSPGQTLQINEPSNYTIYGYLGELGYLSFPIIFNNASKDVNFEIGCHSAKENTRFDLMPTIGREKEEKSANWSVGRGSLELFAYFGFGNADPFILSNNQDFGSKLDYVGNGTIRLLVFPTSNVRQEVNFDCTLTIVSRDSPERQKREFYLTFKE